MRYRVNTYEIGFGTMPDAILITFPVSEEVYSALSASMSNALKREVTEAVRLIVNETRGGVIIMSTGQKGVVQYVTKNTATVSGATVYKVMIRIPISTLITLADGDEDEIAAINAMTTGDMYTIEMDWGDVSESGSYSELVADFFNITEATEYTALTPAEAIAIARDCQYNVMGTDWPIPTWLPTGVTEAQVESAAEGLGIPYHEPTQQA